MDSSRATKMPLFPEREHSWMGVSMDCNSEKRNDLNSFSREQNLNTRASFFTNIYQRVENLNLR